MERIQLVLTKADMATEASIDAAIELVSTHGFINPIIISSHSGTGIEELRTTMLHSLFGPQRIVLLEPGTQEEPAIEALLSRLFDTVYVHEHRRVGDGIEVRISASDETLAILQATYGERIELK
jgi:50S ribosomal subunit-associated GTPase HflX